MANTDEDQMRREIPGVVPMLDYEDASAAIRWLERAFGFREQFRIPDSEGRIDHAELDTGHGVIMLASAPSPALSMSQAAPRGVRASTGMVEGHRWMFMQRLETPPNKASAADARPSRG
jgi:hypothetical protein